jgi:2-keto-4-pentenoate hydratase/2-oxohepta-3-ene-1,7-dioic acid hydratase in catechol pathway
MPESRNARPGKIVCIGRNYREHAKELGNEVPTEPLFFLKPSSSIIADGDAIVLPKQSERVEFEGEIGVVIGRALTRASESEAESAIAGVLAINDVTARDLQRKDSQWTRAKGFDTFCPMGPRFSGQARSREPHSHYARQRQGNAARIEQRDGFFHPYGALVRITCDDSRTRRHCRNRNPVRRRSACGR